ncbi:hypothetical protein FGF66_00885 [Chlorobaculum thiosulfatiphilum]|uniref:Uncharacterized protein n=1 Tax=Chlorobaculum thiosulfatiphilum TaxID=115852 RepID=A0A5C4S9Z1_CHLTI|nr:SIR2 family protein [Chlorobaculum thiosulfatiphilum]TNJ40344.1 hypothetical protein FGF66_00885 [Chlorobaculum thiosulfatiphilum]
MDLDGLISIIKNGNAAFFVGAGISRQAGIPMARDIECGIINVLGVEDNDAVVYKEKQLPLEATIESIIKYTSSSEKLFAIFHNVSPQRNHQLIARLAHSDKYQVPVVLTTNFDTLIEQAGAFNVFVDGVHQPSMIKGLEFPCLVKLHGCVNSIGALCATIKDVANERAFERRRYALKYFLDGVKIKDVIVLGYSFSDKFDISPLLRALQLPVRFWIINHNDSNLLRSNSLSDMPDDYPLRSYDGALIDLNTDKFIDVLWAKTQNDPVNSLAYEKLQYDAKLALWRDDIEWKNGYGIVSLISAVLFRNANCYNLSNRYAERAMGEFDKSSALDYMCILSQLMGDNLRDLGDLSEAVKNFKYANKYAKISNRVDYSAKSLNSLGVVMEDYAKDMDIKNESAFPHSSRRKAIKYYDLAIKRAEYVNDKELSSICEANKAIAMKNIQNKKYRIYAFSILHRSLKVAKKVGDVKSVARYYGMMASCLSLLGRKKWAIDLWFRAMQTSKDIGDSQHVAIWTANLGEDYIDIDKIEAEVYINDAKTSFAKLKMIPQEKYCDYLLEKMCKNI